MNQVGRSRSLTGQTSAGQVIAARDNAGSVGTTSNGVNLNGVNLNGVNPIGANRSGTIIAHADEGSGTMAGVALIMLVAVLLTSVATAGHLLTRRAVARSAADLAALSAAVALRDGRGEPCVVAAAVASAHGGDLTSCAIGGDLGGDVTVRVALATDVPFMPHVGIDARAGPVACGSTA